MADAKFLDFNGLKHFWEKIKGNLVGKKTSGGGEIFNDYVNNVASGSYSHAEGRSTIASGQYSHAEGSSTTASGQYSHAEGSSTTASGDRSHAEGWMSVAYEYAAHAEGNQTKAYGRFSHAEGEMTSSFGTSAHSEGVGNSWSSFVSISNCRGNNFDSNSDFLVVNNVYKDYEKNIYFKIIKKTGNTFTIDKDCDEIGLVNSTRLIAYRNCAYGIGSHAEGNYTKALDTGSHSEGWYTNACQKGEHAEGYFNVSYNSDEPAERVIHSVGIGSSESERKNAQEIKFNGDYYVYGIGGYDGTNPSSSDTLQDVINSYTRITEEEINNLTK